jgi:hypothetical protein
MTDGGDDNKTCVCTECLNDAHLSPLTPTQAMVLPCILKLTFPVDSARFPAQNGMESLTTQMSKMI